jgi:hypothetical protein
VSDAYAHAFTDGMQSALAGAGIALGLALVLIAAVPAGAH